MINIKETYTIGLLNEVQVYLSYNNLMRYTSAQTEYIVNDVAFLFFSQDSFLLGTSHNLERQ